MNEKLIKIQMLISFIGIMFSFWLISKDIKTPGFCPSLFFIPACYVVLVSFLMVYISTYLRKNFIKELVFYIGSILGLLTGTWFSINQLISYKECPTFFGIPLCYISFFSFLILILLNVLLVIDKSKKGKVGGI